MTEATAPTFVGSIPENYDSCLGPIIFQPYAEDLAARLAGQPLNDVLELACGTGILTTEFRKVLQPECRLTASDLSESMIQLAQSKPYAGPVDWAVIDATSIPYPDNSCDAVVCQFGVMFFPDKPAAMAEVLRVLRPGGTFLFNVWDRIEENDFPRISQQTVLPMFGDDPPPFYGIPFGYFDHDEIRRDLSGSGFVDVTLDVLRKQVQSATARQAATGFVKGNPIRSEIEERLGDVSSVVDQVAAAIAAELGNNPACGNAQAIIGTARKA